MKIDSLITQSSAFAIFSAFPSLETHTDCNIITGPSGTGKSALLTHIGLYFILRGYKILHLSLRDPQVHIQSFYDEIFTELALRQPQKSQDQTGARLAIERNRMIISTDQPCTNDFLKQRVQLLHEFLDFSPHLILIDGHAPSDQSIDNFKEICAEYNCAIWFAGANLDITNHNYIQIRPQDNHVILHCRCNDDQKDILANTVTLCLQKSVSSTLHQRLPSPKPENCQFYSGGAMGAEAYFGEMCEKFQIQEINYTFQGHNQKRTQGRYILSDQELAAGQVSLAYVSRRLHRHWDRTPLLRKVLQVLWHVVSNVDQLFVIGVIQEDNSVHGGTGWSVELAKRWHKTVWVYDQEQKDWFFWETDMWLRGTPLITTPKFAGSGTRFLTEDGRNAIEELFTRSFTKTPAS